MFIKETRKLLHYTSLNKAPEFTTVRFIEEFVQKFLLYVLSAGVQNKHFQPRDYDCLFFGKVFMSVARAHEQFCCYYSRRKAPS